MFSAHLSLMKRRHPEKCDNDYRLCKKTLKLTIWRSIRNISPKSYSRETVYALQSDTYLLRAQETRTISLRVCARW